MKKRAAFVIPALLLSACGSSGEGVSVTDSWARTTAPGQTVGAIYFDLTVDENDTLIGAAVPSDIAVRAEIHEVVMAGDGDSDMEMSGDADEMEMSAGSSDMDEMSGETGAMRMQELPNGLALTSGEMVSFEPGSYHVMLPELTAPLESGDEFELTLDFENADDVTVTVEVADTAP